MYIFPGMHLKLSSFSENYYRQHNNFKRAKKMHFKALIILPSLECAIALLLYSLAFSTFSLQFNLIPSV